MEPAPRLPRGGAGCAAVAIGASGGPSAAAKLDAESLFNIVESDDEDDEDEEGGPLAVR